MNVRIDQTTVREQPRYTVVGFGTPDPPSVLNPEIK